MMQVTMMLCDYAQVADGKLYINGGGWSLVDSHTPPSAIAMLVMVPWDRAGTPLQLDLSLIDEDGHPVVQQVDDAVNPLHIGVRLEVERPAAQPAGVPIDVPMALGIPPLQLRPFGRFAWQLSTDGQHREDWNLSFSTRA